MLVPCMKRRFQKSFFLKEKKHKSEDCSVIGVRVEGVGCLRDLQDNMQGMVKTAI